MTSQSLTKLCRLHQISRQSYYRHQRCQEQTTTAEVEFLTAIRTLRRRQPRVGGRKLHRMLTANNARIGRDRLFAVLRKHHMLVHRRKQYTTTTNARHRFRVYSNEIHSLDITRSGQVYVSDQTYIRTRQGWSYLSLVTDVYSRKIVGHALTESLSAAGPLAAMEQALALTDDPASLIHHSDRGSQYCCHVYTNRLHAHGVTISMAAGGNPYENAVAERVNGILKDEFFLGEEFPSHDLAQKAVEEAISIYNTERLHTSLGYRTPDDVFFS